MLTQAHTDRERKGLAQGCSCHLATELRMRKRLNLGKRKLKEHNKSKPQQWIYGLYTIHTPTGNTCTFIDVTLSVMSTLLLSL